MPHKEKITLEIIILEAESAVLGSILEDGSIIDRCELTPAHFTGKTRREMFRTMLKMKNRGEPLEYLAIQARMIEDGPLTDAEVFCLYETEEYRTYVDSWEYYRNMILRWHNDRRISDLTADLQIRLASSPDKAAVLEEYKTQIAELSREIGGSKPMKFDDCLDKTMLEFRDTQEGAPDEWIVTGFADLDKVIGGIPRGEVMVVAGRPGMGKSTLSMQIAQSVSKITPVLFISSEMSAGLLTRKEIASEGGWRTFDLEAMARAGRVGEIDKAARELRGMNIYVEATPGTVDRVASLIAKYRKKYGVGVVAIDYLQRLRLDKTTGNRFLDVGEMARKVKDAAQDYGVGIILAAQIGRPKDGKEGTIPGMADLSESGKIEMEAATILILHRPGYYDPTKATEANIFIPKSRYGESGKVVPMFWDTKKARFKNAGREYEDPRNDWEGRRRC